MMLAWIHIKIIKWVFRTPKILHEVKIEYKMTGLVTTHNGSELLGHPSLTQHLVKPGMPMRDCFPLLGSFWTERCPLGNFRRQQDLSGLSSRPSLPQRGSVAEATN